MSSVTVSGLERIGADELAELLLASDRTLEEDGGEAGESKIAVVDVRDDDHIGGHIKNSMHFPSVSLDAMMPTLVRKLQDKETVVFHCALSQQRGPGAALRYLREKEAASGSKGGSKGEEKKQKVYVLDRGFVGWQERFGLDVRLTEGYRKEIWEGGW